MGASKEVKLMALGQYELVVVEALERLSNGPWIATDLERVGEIINDELCGGCGPDCNSSAVLDWLRSLGEKDREELVFQANADWSEKQGI
jgi:hypothetical protein